MIFSLSRLNNLGIDGEERGRGSISSVDDHLSDWAGGYGDKSCRVEMAERTNDTMTLIELAQKLTDLRNNELARGIDLAGVECWADSDSEGYRFKVNQVFVKKYAGQARIILQGD